MTIPTRALVVVVVVVVDDDVDFPFTSHPPWFQPSNPLEKRGLVANPLVRLSFEDPDHLVFESVSGTAGAACRRSEKGSNFEKGWWMLTFMTTAEYLYNIQCIVFLYIYTYMLITIFNCVYYAYHARLYFHFIV